MLSAEWDHYGMEKSLNMLLCRFQEAHATQDALLFLLPSWQSLSLKSGYIGTMLMDLFKAYDYLSIVAKLEGYGVDEKGLYLIP